MTRRSGIGAVRVWRAAPAAPGARRLCAHAPGAPWLNRLLYLVVRVWPPPPERQASLLISRLSAFCRSCAGPPEADEPGDQRDQEDLAGQHLEHGQDLADVPGRHEVAVAGRRQRRVAEEQIVPSLRVRDTGENIAADQASKREEQEAEQQAEQREDADRPQDRPEIDHRGWNDAAQDRDRRYREQKRVDDERRAQQRI